jgi:hypothetical protein
VDIKAKKISKVGLKAKIHKLQKKISIILHHYKIKIKNSFQKKKRKNSTQFLKTSKKYKIQNLILICLKINYKSKSTALLPLEL